jgi:NAD(P)-dependent dehydrogenase (short-subunit alcohol dehydrogenase family)
MSTIDATGLLRPGLLETCSVLVACPPPPPADALGEAAVKGDALGEAVAKGGDTLGEAVAEGCAALGARVQRCQPDAAAEQPLDAAVAAALAAAGRIDMLAVDGAGLFTGGLARGGDAHEALRTCVDAAWNVTRAVVNLAFLPEERGGRVVYLAPPPDAGEHAQAARAGLENLARTLSVEWARHRVTTVTIAPGAGTAAGEVAALCAYLASPAGDYFSGCLLDLRGP